MHDVDIYSVDLDATDASDCSVLAHDEIERASQFRFERDRRRFVNCRSALRRFLAQHLDVAPPLIRFTYNAYGKPVVNGIHFNVSHADRIAMIAISHHHELGIDVERIDESFVDEHIPERFFSPREVQTLRSLPAAQQVEQFFQYWTRKEAYMKARGLGFALDSTSFEVASLPGWSIESILAPAGYAAALCGARTRACRVDTRVDTVFAASGNDFPVCDTL